MKNHPQQTRIASLKPAFTLTEMLVTIVIIITLAVLAFSGLARMRSAADRVGAMRNLSQIQLASINYATDHNGHYLPPYVVDETGASSFPWSSSPEFLANFKSEESIYRSDGKVDQLLPISMMDPIVARAKQRNYQYLSGSFGYMTNGVPDQGRQKPNNRPSFRISQLSAPERTAAFATATDWMITYANRFQWESNKAEGYVGRQRMSYRHNGKALVVYYDGHVGEVSVADIRKIDTQGGSSNIFWRGDAK